MAIATGWWRLGLAVLVLLVLFGSLPNVFSPAFQKCSSEYRTQHASTPDEKNPPSLGVTGYVECMGDFIEANEGSITALATIVIAAFTCTLWRSTTEEGRLTRETLAAEKRAFVFPTGLQIFPEIDHANRTFAWRFRVAMRNSGDTPTKNLRMLTTCELRNTPLPTGFNIDAAPPIVGRGSLGPRYDNSGGLAPLPPLPGISVADIVEVQSGRKMLYLMGWFKYYDTFAGTPEHITKFCWQLIPQGDFTKFIPSSPDHQVSFAYVHDSQGNCFDDECKLSQT